MPRHAVTGRKHYRRRRVGRKRFRPNKKPGAPAKPLSSGKVYNFKRTAINVIPLDTTNIPAGSGWVGNGTNTEIRKTWVFNLSDSVPDYSEFTRLFKYWRIKGVRIQAWVSNNTSGAHDSTEYSNSQLLMYSDRNMDGTDMPDEQSYLDSQTRKTQLMTNTGKKPALDIYMNANQATQVYNSTVNTDYTFTKPKWISTSEPGTQHYTHNNLIKRIDAQPFTTNFTNFQYLRLHYTIYFQCKKVQ